ncbi:MULTISPECIES: hypothetical protein [Telluria group]|jgi:hypothetical protein|nr:MULTISPECIES: hypothetical protein [Telluria group]WEF32599.1 hypothetical protein PX653_24830 [Pseudoduganella chitinolytica]
MQVQHQLPKDIYFPEIDEATRQMIDATDAQARRAQADKVPAPMPFNAEAIRTLPPAARAAFRYIWEREQRRYEEFMLNNRAAAN